MADEKLVAIMSSIERRGPWIVPAHLECRVRMGNIELDLREAVLADNTTIEAHVSFGNLEIIIPHGLIVDVAVSTVAGSVEDWRPEASVDGNAKHLRITGKVKFGNCEIIPLRPGETLYDHARRVRAEVRRRHHRRHHDKHRRIKELEDERELWRASPDRSHWLPWWLQAQMRRRMFTWFAIMFVTGVAAGVHFWGDRHWWYFPIAVIVLSIVSGMVAWRMTRPLLLVVKAARDIGDGKFDTRLSTRQRGEMRVLANAINDMASRIETQIKDQRQLLAAVSHELRTPLGHMRVLIETARDHHDLKALEELDREVIILDDLVGRLLASSRLEFGNLDRRQVDLGELVSDVATTAGLAPEQIEAIGDVRAPVDPTLVRRAVANLLDNARIHGRGATAVRIVRRGLQVAIEVDDAGPGVAADRRADAFRAFVPSSGGGLGLGLALVSRIAVAHDGGAWIDDRPGGGARVGFTVSSRS